jgi:hypothetical protein
MFVKCLIGLTVGNAQRTAVIFLVKCVADRSSTYFLLLPLSVLSLL